MIAAQEPEGLLLSEAGCTLGGAGRGREKADGSLGGERELQEWGRDGVWSCSPLGRAALCCSSALLSSFIWGKLCTGCSFRTRWSGCDFWRLFFFLWNSLTIELTGSWRNVPWEALSYFKAPLQAIMLLPAMIRSMIGEVWSFAGQLKEWFQLRMVSSSLYWCVPRAARMSPLLAFAWPGNPSIHWGSCVHPFHHFKYMWWEANFI